MTLLCYLRNSSSDDYAFTDATTTHASNMTLCVVSSQVFTAALVLRVNQVRQVFVRPPVRVSERAGRVRPDDGCVHGAVGVVLLRKQPPRHVPYFVRAALQQLRAAALPALVGHAADPIANTHRCWCLRRVHAAKDGELGLVQVAVADATVTARSPFERRTEGAQRRLCVRIVV